MKYYTILFLLLSAILLSSCKKDENQEFIDEQNGDVKEQTTKKDTGRKELSINDTSGIEANISPLEAKSYIGMKARVRGFIADVTRTDKVAYLNFVERYPKNPFTCVIFASKFADFGEIIMYEGKEVEVIGLISTFRGKTQMVLNSPSQIKVIK